MARADGIDELDPRFPIRHSEEAAVFWRLLRHPPVTSRWRAHLEFTVAETMRAVASQAAPVETFVVPMGDTMPIPVVRAGRVYPPLFEETLAHEFTDADRAALVAALGPGEVVA